MKREPIHGKMPVLIILLAASLTAMWLLSRCTRSNEKSIANIYMRPGGDTLSIAIELSPTSYAFSGDSAVGFDYEMIRQIAARHHIETVIHPFAPIDYALKGLRNGDFDIVIANMPASPEIRDEFLLTDDIFTDRQVLVRLADTSEAAEPTRPPQMALLHDTVWIADSSPFRTRLANLSHELGDTIYIKSEPGYSAEHLVVLTAMGEIKQAVVNETVVKKMIEDYPQLDISAAISTPQLQPWIVAAGKQSLRDSLNIWIEKFKSDPAYQVLVEKYLSPAVSHHFN